MVNKQIIQMEIVRKDGKTIFKFKVPEKITAIYKTMASGEQESKNWKGLKFYKMSDMLDDPIYQQKLRRFMLIDEFGSNFYSRGQLNIAWLRTVGGEGEITIADSVSFADLSVLVKNCTQFVKQHFEEHYTDFKITGSVTLEI